MQKKQFMLSCLIYTQLIAFFNNSTSFCKLIKMNLIDMFFRSSAEINGYFNREEIEFPYVTVLHEMWAITEHYQTTKRCDKQ